MSYKVVYKTCGKVTKSHPDPGPHTFTYGGQEHTVTYSDLDTPDVDFKYQAWKQVKDNGDGTYMWRLTIDDSVDPGTVDSEGEPPSGVTDGHVWGINDE